MATDREILRRSQERRKKRRIAKIVFWLVLAGLVFYLSVLFFSWPALRLQNIKVEGNYSVSSEAISARARELLAGNYLGLYPRDNIFLWPKSAVFSGLARSFPRLKSIALSQPDRQTLLIDVEERAPAFSWCQEASSTSELHNCQLIDDQGHSCGQAPIFSETVYPVLTGDFINGSNTSQLLSPGDFNNLGDFIMGLKKVLSTENKPLGLYRVVALGDGDCKALVSLNGDRDNSWQIIFNTDTKSADLLNNFQTVFNSDMFRAELEKNAWKLDYIDLRFGQKIFYKFD